MNYAIEILEWDAEQLKNCLSEWDLKCYPDARTERDKKLKSLEKAISYLKSAESFNNAVEGKTL